MRSEFKKKFVFCRTHRLRPVLIRTEILFQRYKKKPVTLRKKKLTVETVYLNQINFMTYTCMKK